MLSDKFREPTGMLISTVCLGFLLCLPAGILNEIFIFSQNEPENFYFIAGFTEEILKFCAFWFFIRKRIEFNEPMDAIVYGALISLGFATYENYEYVYLYSDDFNLSSLEIAQVRAVTAVPLHAFCGIIMGYNLAIYFSRKTPIYLYLSILFPISLHSFYNFIDNLFATYIIITISLVICVYLHRNLVEQQKKKKHEQEFG